MTIALVKKQWRAWGGADRLAIALLGLTLVTRLLWLDADPNVFKRPGDVFDEGWYLSASRTLVLFGAETLAADDFHVSEWAAPFFLIVTYPVFLAFGVSLYTGRLISVVSAFATLAMVYWILRRRGNATVGLWAALLLASSVHFYNYNRLGLIDNLTLCLSLASLLAWLRPGDRPATSAVVSGALMGLAFLSKIWPYVFFPFGILAAIQMAQGRWQWRRFGWFAVSAGSLSAAHLAYVLLNYSQFASAIQFNAEGFSVPWHGIDLIFQPFQVGVNRVLILFPTLPLVALALPRWSQDVGRLIASPRDFVRAMPLDDQVWWSLLIGTLAIGLLRDYGDRRMFPLLIPLGVFAAKSLTQTRFAGDFDPEKTWSSAVAAVGLAIPVYWLFAYWKMRVAPSNPYQNGSPEWYLSQAGPLVILAIGYVANALIYRRAFNRDPRYVLVSASAAYLFVVSNAAVVGLLHDQFRLDPDPWQVAGMALVVFAGAGFVFSKAPVSSRFRLWTGSVLSVYLLVNLAVISRDLIRPTFTIRDASRAIGRHVARGEMLLTNLQTLCLENQAVCRYQMDTPDSAAQAGYPMSQSARPRFWLADSTTPPTGGEQDACLEDEGVMLGGVVPLETFALQTGYGERDVVLYAVDPSDARCQASQSGTDLARAGAGNWCPVPTEPFRCSD